MGGIYYVIVRKVTLRMTPNRKAKCGSVPDSFCFSPLDWTAVFVQAW